MEMWPLLDANDVAGIREAFSRHPEEINAFSGIAGGTLLHEAARRSGPEMLHAMVELGFDVNLGSEGDGCLPILSAAQCAKVANVEFLIERGSKLDVSEPIRNALYGAIIAGRGNAEERVMIRAPEVALALLKAGFDFRKEYPKRVARHRNAYEKAEVWGAREIVELLLAWERSQRMQQVFEVPFVAAFYRAVSTSNLSALRDLREAFPEKLHGDKKLFGENPTAFGSWLHCASVNSSPEIAAYLIGLGEEVEAKGRGWTPICTAAGNDNPAMVRFLLEAGAKVQFDRDNSPLLFAVRANSVESTKLLLDAGIDPRTKFGCKDAEAFAREWRKPEIADLIASYK